ncbi:STAS domain-containing protein [Actinomadura fulvescens]|uniref:Anti-sigma factor antagonist n=1 Tax=Actinomadura fulvescens TaxID=46160 RepID=A0ABN3QLG6_9ACTN
MDALRLTTRYHGGSAIIVITGSLDICGTHPLQDRLREVLRQLSDGDPAARLVLDTSGITFIDAAGLGALISVQNEARRHPIPLLLTAPSPALHRVLELTKLGDHFTTLPTPDADLATAHPVRQLPQA